MDVLAAAHAYLPGGKGVVGDGRGVREPASAAPLHLVIAVVRVRVVAVQRHRHVGGVELFEFRDGAAEPDLARRGVDADQVERDKPALELAVVDHQVGDGPSPRVDDHAAHFAANPIGTADVSADRQRRYACHGRTPCFLGL
jgi:hypothetical protein